MKKAAYYWLPAIIWMIVIFTLSARQRIVLSEESTINFVIFKMLHMIEYATLYTLLLRGFAMGRHTQVHNFYKKAFVVAVLYATSDEIHQTFTPTREGTPRDVVIDTVGITIMYFVIKKNLRSLYNVFT